MYIYIHVCLHMYVCTCTHAVLIDVVNTRYISLLCCEQMCVVCIFLCVCVRVCAHIHIHNMCVSYTHTIICVCT